MTRLSLDMHINDALFKMSGGNPGALHVLMESIRTSPKIDPANAMGEWGFIINLDALEIYESQIWVLYKDLCGEDLTKTIALVRSVQMGILAKEKLLNAMSKTETIDIDHIVGLLQESLPEFQA